MTTYAMTDRVPERAQHYLTPGKRYRVTSEEGVLLDIVAVLERLENRP